MACPDKKADCPFAEAAVSQKRTLANVLVEAILGRSLNIYYPGK